MWHKDDALVAFVEKPLDEFRVFLLPLDDRELIANDHTFTAHGITTFTGYDIGTICAITFWRSKHIADSVHSGMGMNLDRANIT